MQNSILRSTDFKIKEGLKRFHQNAMTSFWILYEVSNDTIEKAWIRGSLSLYSKRDIFFHISCASWIENLCILHLLLANASMRNQNPFDLRRNHNNRPNWNNMVDSIRNIGREKVVIIVPAVSAFISFLVGTTICVTMLKSRTKLKVRK